MPGIAVIGLGLIGSSLGLALRAGGLTGVEVVGYDADAEAGALSLRRQAVDRVAPSLQQAVRDAGLIVIATPVLAIRDVLQRIAPHVRDGATVTDTGSTKQRVMAWAAERLPSRVSFVGGHPMAGKTEAGPEAAEAGLFTGAVYCIVPGRNAAPKAVQMVTGLAHVVGAAPFQVGAAEHDSYVAAISHLPIALSVALTSCTIGSPSWGEMAHLAAGGYRDVTRLAQGDPVMSRDIFLTNGEAIAHWIDQVVQGLQGIKALLGDGSAGSGERLEEMFVQAWKARHDWMAGVAAGKGQPESASEAVEALARAIRGN